MTRASKARYCAAAELSILACVWILDHQYITHAESDVPGTVFSVIPRDLFDSFGKPAFCVGFWVFDVFGWGTKLDSMVEIKPALEDSVDSVHSLGAGGEQGESRYRLLYSKSKVS